MHPVARALLHGEALVNVSGAAAPKRYPSASGVTFVTSALAWASTSLSTTCRIALFSSTSSSSAENGTNAGTASGSVELGEMASSGAVQEDGEHGQLPSHPQLVNTYLGAGVMSQRERIKARKADVIQPFQRFEGDVGSPEVQVALLTDRIRSLGAHFKANKKDFHGQRGLQGMLNQRRALLSYLRRRDFQRFAFVLHALGLKDVYAMQTRYDKYRVGTRLGDAAEPIKRYKT